MSGKNDDKGIDGRDKVVIRALDFYFTGFIDMMGNMIMMMNAEMGVDERRVFVVAIIVMDVLKRRKNKTGHERQTAQDRGNTPHRM